MVLYHLCKLKQSYIDNLNTNLVHSKPKTNEAGRKGRERQIFRSWLYLHDHLRCAVHTLQLAIRDGLKGQHASNLISKLRQVAVAARMPKIYSIIKRRTGKGAIVDQGTRWGRI